jgi:hypothetical protein
MSEDWNAAIFALHRRIDMRAPEIDLVFAESIGPSAPQAPAIVWLHCRHHLGAVPGFGAFQHVPRIGVDIEAAGAAGKQTPEEFGHHPVELAQ